MRRDPVTVIINNNLDQSELETFMSELTDAVEALTAGVNSHGEAIQGALARVNEDFAVLTAKLDAALADDAEASQAAQRITASLAQIQASSDTLAALDPDPSNPVVGPPEDEPPVEEPPVESGGVSSG